MNKELVNKLQEELNNLNDKIKRLNNFINTNEIFIDLPLEEQQVMRDQLSAMRFYKQCLKDRIEINGRKEAEEQTIKSLFENIDNSIKEMFPEIKYYKKEF